MGKFKKGFLFGGLLGAGIMWMSTTKKGREVRDQLLDHAAEVYGRVKVDLLSSKKVKDLNKNMYVKKVTEVVDKYAIENGLADNVKQMVMKVVLQQWDKIKKDFKKL
ncbi:MAG: YtxH domain-containing protein [Candidatus Magasanikbacteria bacterium]|jgi:hypothetical protein|nr:YtxH domain-containing protein [Candidatus Magasanikbacteria bacterium]MBT4071321.1 YtxH domain-containing protein [Candidatus Magasanikbacteria bacterium]